MTQLEYTTIEDDTVPLTNAIQGETSVAEMHQNAGAAWFGDSSNGNIWDQKITQWFGQKFQKIFPAFKDSSIELTAGLLWGYIKQDTLKQADADSKEDSLGTKVLDGFQLALDIVGFIPAYGEIADGINAGIYAMRGDYLNAGLSLAACVPVLGIGATGGKVINKGIKLIDKADDIYDAAKSAAKIIDDGISKGPVIIGETMKRVEAAAEKYIDSKILNDMPEYWNMGLKDYEVTSKMMEYNRKWILDQLRSAREIIDIGLDASRKTPSIFYEMEQNMIKNYQKLHPEWSAYTKLQ